MKKNVIITLLVAVSLAVALFTVILVGGQSVEYDPWIDVNDDGKIDMKDIGQVARAFGATGTAINKTALLLELQDGLAELNATVDDLQEQINQLSDVHVEGGEYDGVVNADMVEYSGVTTINFPTPFISTAKPIMIITVVLKEAADGLTEGSAIKVVEDIKGAANNWTGFDLTVSKYSGGSITDTTQVYVTWLAVGQ